MDISTIPVVKKNPKEFLIATYARTNNSWPSDLDVAVNGIQGQLKEGEKRILPRFLIEQAKTAYNFTHRERNPDDKNENYETIQTKPSIDTFEIPDEFQSPEGVMKLLELAKGIKDRAHPYYGLQLGVKTLHYGDMRPAEQKASAELAERGDDIVTQLQDELKAKDAMLASTNLALEALSAKVDALASGGAPADEPAKEVYEFDGKEYKTESAMKSAMTKKAKADEAQAKAKAEAEEAEAKAEAEKEDDPISVEN